MVDTQHFCLRWNNYQSSITSAFENLRDDEDFVDVTLACDGKSLKAHRVVLSACSPYFRELLKSTPCKHPVIVLQDVAFTDLHALVEFIYHGEVNVHQRSLSSFLKTAEVLRVSGLTQQQHHHHHSNSTPTDERDQLAQVASLNALRAPLGAHAGASYTDKLVEEALFPAPASPTAAGAAATVNQLLRRAAAAHRRDRRLNSDPDPDHKRARADTAPHHHLHHNNNNNNNNHDMAAPQVAPTDFSPTAMKNNNNIANHAVPAAKPETDNNGLNNNGSGTGSGVSGADREASPAADGRLDDVKAEPMELLCGSGQDLDNSSDSLDGGGEGTGALPQGPLSGSSAGDHDESGGPAYLTSAESKLFASAAGSFNFSMAALAADPTGLAGLNQSLQGNSDSLAGTSQGLEEFRCHPCNKSLSSLTRLKRHIQNVHMRPSREPVCNICKRVYSSLNSLRNHKSIYHRNAKERKVAVATTPIPEDLTSATHQHPLAAHQHHPFFHHPALN